MQKVTTIEIYITVLLHVLYIKKVTRTRGIYITCAFSFYINEFTINRYVVNFHVCTSGSICYPEIHCVGRMQVNTFNASPSCYYQIKTSRAGGYI
jgi:hypothetical protein